MKQLRRELSVPDKKRMDEAILKNLLKLPGMDKPSAVYCYVSVNGEADTRELLKRLWGLGFLVAVPRVESSRIRFYRVDRMEDLEPGCMGIPEPKKGCVPADFGDAAVITPGLAFTQDGDRIGYGGGFYDRFFEEQPGHERIGVAYPFQIVRELPVEPCDRKIHRIVTSDGILDCRQKKTAEEWED